MSKIRTFLTIAAAAFTFNSVSAITIGDDVTLGGVERKAALSPAVSGEGFTGSGNATDATLNGNAGFSALVAPSTWTERGEETVSGPSGIFDVTLTSGSWGSGNAGGTWMITDASFWTKYAYGAISMHIGDGEGDPDHFVWRIQTGNLSGEWIYEKISGEGGGLSNLKLYSAGTGTRVPDAGSTLALLGLGPGLLGFLKRRK